MVLIKAVLTLWKSHFGFWQRSGLQMTMSLWQVQSWQVSGLHDVLFCREREREGGVGEFRFNAGVSGMLFFVQLSHRPLISGGEKQLRQPEAFRCASA